MTEASVLFAAELFRFHPVPLSNKAYPCIDVLLLRRIHGVITV